MRSGAGSLAVAAIFILRRKRPAAERPYRCPGYPWVPALFVAASAAMTALGLIEDARHNLMWVGVLLAGAPVYLAWRRLT